MLCILGLDARTLVGKFPRVESTEHFTQPAYGRDTIALHALEHHATLRPLLTQPLQTTLEPARLGLARVW